VDVEAGGRLQGHVALADPAAGSQLVPGVVAMSEATARCGCGASLTISGNSIDLAYRLDGFWEKHTHTEPVELEPVVGCVPCDCEEGPADDQREHA